MKFYFTIVFTVFFSFFGCSEDFIQESQNNEIDGDIGIGELLPQALLHDGELREYLLYVPESHNESVKSPILFNFHGGDAVASNQVYISDMRSIADTANFILVYPQGLTGSWNSSLPTNTISKLKTDDFGFIEAMINKINSNYNADTSRVYATGYSNGADISLALASVLSEKIAAVVSISGLLDKHTAQNTAPTAVGIMSIHGTSDKIRPYYYGLNGYYFTIDELNAYWSQVNNCNGVANMKTFTSGSQMIELTSYSGCKNKASVDHYKVISGQHDWFNIVLNGVLTDQLIWNFLSQFDLNGKIIN